MTREELAVKWERNNNPRVRDALLDRTLFGFAIIWEKGQPYRVLREGGGPPRHVPVPRWTTNRTLAKQLAHGRHPTRIPAGAGPEEICLRVLIRHLETGSGLWPASNGSQLFSAAACHNITDGMM